MAFVWIVESASSLPEGAYELTGVFGSAAGAYREAQKLRRLYAQCDDDIDRWRGGRMRGETRDWDVRIRKAPIYQ